MYIEMNRVFRDRATAIEIQCRTSQRVCGLLAKRFATERPKDQHEFEKLEYLKEFVISTSKANEITLELLLYIKECLTQVTQDARQLHDVAMLRDIAAFDKESIMIITAQRNEAYDLLGRNKKDS